MDWWPSLRPFAAGSFSGVALVLAGHPFDTVKVRLQTAPDGYFKGPIDCVKRTLKQEGIAALYKGATPPLVATGGINAALFGMMGVCQERKRQMRQVEGALPLTDVMLCGMVTGWAASTFVTPIENVKTKLQIQYQARDQRLYSGPIDCALKLLRTNGVRGLYAGFIPTIFHRGSNWAYFGGYEFARRNVFSQADGTPRFGRSISAIGSGAFAGTAFWLSCYPIDVVKGRMQAAPVEAPFPSVWSCVHGIYAQGGLRAFFRGFTPCLLRSVPANSAAFLAYDFATRHLP